MSSKVKGDGAAFDEDRNEAVSFIKRNVDAFNIEKNGEYTVLTIRKQL